MDTLSGFLALMRYYDCGIEVELRNNLPVITVRHEGEEFEFRFPDLSIESLAIRDTVNGDILNIDDFNELADVILDFEDEE